MLLAQYISYVFNFILLILVHVGPYNGHGYHEYQVPGYTLSQHETRNNFLMTCYLDWLEAGSLCTVPYIGPTC